MKKIGTCVHCSVRPICPVFSRVHDRQLSQSGARDRERGQSEEQILPRPALSPDQQMRQCHDRTSPDATAQINVTQLIKI